MRKVNHFGIPTTIVQPGECYAEGLKVWLTDFTKSKNRIEFLRFEPETWMPELIQNVAHIAYEVPDLEAELKGAHVIVEPMDCGDKFIAFVEEDEFLSNPQKYINNAYDKSEKDAEGYNLTKQR